MSYLPFIFSIHNAFVRPYVSGGKLNIHSHTLRLAYFTLKVVVADLSGAWERRHHRFISRFAQRATKPSFRSYHFPEFRLKLTSPRHIMKEEGQGLSHNGRVVTSPLVLTSDSILPAGLWNRSIIGYWVKNQEFHLKSLKYDLATFFFFFFSCIQTSVGSKDYI